MKKYKKQGGKINVKKLLSMVLALALIISLVPSVFATEGESETEKGARIFYSVGTDAYSNKDSEFLTALTSKATNYFYEFAGTNTNKDNGDNIKGEGETAYFKPRENGIQIGSGKAVSFKVYIPVAGEYTMEMHNNEYLEGGKIQVYQASLTEFKKVEDSSADGLGKYVGEYICYNGGLGENKFPIVETPNYISGFSFDTSGWYVISFKSDYYYPDPANPEKRYRTGFAGNFYLTCGEGAIVPMYAPLTITDDTASVASEVVMSNKTTQTLDNTFTVTYDSSNKAVATVAADGKITKLANGETEITATVAKNGGVAKSSIAYAVTDVAEEVPEYSTAVFSAVTDVDGYNVPEVSVTVDGTENTNKVISAERGSAIVATAPEISGYKFVGWKRGSNNENDDYKAYISDKNPLEMSLLTNTFVTACYVTDTYENEPVVEYYNQNGDYIATRKPDEVAPTPDEITGYTFEEDSWFIGENAKLVLANVTKLTRAVACHTPNASVGTATVNGTPVADKTAFDSAITPVASENFTCWKRDGNIVSYNPNYTYYLWDDTVIAESTKEIPAAAYSGTKKLPLIVLESGNGGAYMIEYDKADFEIVEVGILFGSGDVTIDSCSVKYTSQRNSAHGQFTAKASGTAKGYLIYEDSGQYKVIYAD